MRLIDRLILKEFVGPFLFGIGTFMVILVGVQLSPWMLRLLVQEHYPPGIVLRIFLYRLPWAMALTFPMATVFGSLMALAALSSNGEVVAMRAGGVSLLRLAAPILAAGVLISLGNLAFNELLVPGASDAAQVLIAKYAETARPREHLMFAIPKTGPAQRLVYAQLFDPGRKLLQGLTIIEMRDERFWQEFDADEALWQGEQWLLRNVEHTVATPTGSRREHVDLVTYDVGKSPADLSNINKDPWDMSMAELRRELANRRRLHQAYQPHLLEIIQTIQTRWALPWASLGFALIGIPLGLRPARATTGIGLGLSLVIVFAYYIIFHTMDLVGPQGSVPPLITAWFANVVLFGAGVGLFMNARR